MQSLPWDQTTGFLHWKERGPVEKRTVRIVLLLRLHRGWGTRGRLWTPEPPTSVFSSLPLTNKTFRGLYLWSLSQKPLCLHLKSGQTQERLGGKRSHSSPPNLLSFPSATFDRPARLIKQVASARAAVLTQPGHLAFISGLDCLTATFNEDRWRSLSP